MFQMAHMNEEKVILYSNLFNFIVQIFWISGETHIYHLLSILSLR